MNDVLAVLAHGVAGLVGPVLTLGLVDRTRSLWSGRKGPPLAQLAFDLVRLLRKRPVYGAATTTLFRIAPWVFLVTTVVSALVTPLLGVRPLASFPLDFVWFAYVWALGRVALLLAALDTGSSFEGMGAARESLFASLLEPVLFLVFGALSCFAQGTSLFDGVAQPIQGGGSFVVWCGAVVALFVVLQVESGRVPVDDPATHLELTMVHEVMVLDHSGPDLAAIHFASAAKLFLGTTVLATLLNPLAGADGWAVVATHLVLCAAIAVALGTCESLVARWRIRAVPQYIAIALLAGAVALLATAWRTGGAR